MLALSIGGGVNLRSLDILSQSEVMKGVHEDPRKLLSLCG